jgi:hypothetical protein
VVYLFSVDLSSVTLSLAFGTTQFDKQFGGLTNAIPRMRLAATRLQGMFENLIPAHLQRGPIDLAATQRQKLHYAYQQASILSYPPYRIHELPSETELAADLRELVQVYTEIVSDPLEATVERLVEAVAQPAKHVEGWEVRDFAPRAPRVHSASIRLHKFRPRLSFESRKVGNAGERAVVKYEKDRLAKLGRHDLAARVCWHASELDFVGWDITSYDDEGNEIYIEVKSSIGAAFSTFGLTVNEWQNASDPKRRDRYYIYLVTKALSALPHIERLRNPAAYVENHKIACRPVVYEIDLRDASADAAK